MIRIEWTDATWNPVRGCSRVSEGCRNCYAERIAARFCGESQAGGLEVDTSAAFYGFAHRTGTSDGKPAWTGRVELIPEKLEEPLHWRKPRRVFVNSMSDLFHEGLSDEAIDRVFAVMALAQHHTFQVLTKRPERMRAYMGGLPDRDVAVSSDRAHPEGIRTVRGRRDRGSDRLGPLPNVWLGVSVEDQETADERIPLLLQMPAAVRFVSYEPALRPVDLRAYLAEAVFCDPYHDGQLHWLIVGGESGPGARSCNVAWIRSVVRQTREAGLPCFVKQMGSNVRDCNDAGFMGEGPTQWPDHIAEEDRVEHDLDGTLDGYQGAPVRVHLRNSKGGDPSEWPEDLRVREFPA